LVVKAALLDVVGFIPEEMGTNEFDACLAVERFGCNGIDATGIIGGTLSFFFSPTKN